MRITPKLDVYHRSFNGLYREGIAIRFSEEPREVCPVNGEILTTVAIGAWSRDFPLS